MLECHACSAYQVQCVQEKQLSDRIALGCPRNTWLCYFPPNIKRQPFVVCWTSTGCFCRGISYHTLDLESANHTAVSTQPCQSPSTAPKPAPQQDANNTSSLTTVHDQDLSPFGAASAAQLGGVTAASNSQQGGLSGQVPAEAAAERRPSKEQLPSWQKQHSLQTIMEQQKSGDSCYSAQAQPASTGTPAAELEVFESPFASADSNNYSGELTASTLNNGSLAYKAGGVVTANGATAAEASCAKTHSLPVAQGSKAEAGGMQQLQQQASCSVPRPGLARKTSLLLSQKPSILQVQHSYA